MLRSERPHHKYMNHFCTYAKSHKLQVGIGFSLYLVSKGQKKW